jgi:MYXO-CTERM domain-containing protein
MIAEFFWFESSIDRGSDFWVAVVKARTSPNLTDGWLLELQDDPILSVQAETMNEDRNAGFRWDWSVPFESYGWDSYGNITLETVYGIGSAAEGSALVAYEQKETESGVTEEVEANIQAKGYFNSEYRVQTKYQVTLWRWEMFVHGTPQDLSWDLYLDSPDRQDQNAYHEYFLVMQADEDKGFSLDRLQLSGTVTDPRWYWWDAHSQMSIALNNIQLERPETAWDNWEGDDDNEAPDLDEDEEDEEIEELDEEQDSTDDQDDQDIESGTSTTVNVTNPSAADGCSTSGTRTGPLGLVLALGLALIGRRRT